MVIGKTFFKRDFFILFFLLTIFNSGQLRLRHWLGQISSTSQRLAKAGEQNTVDLLHCRWVSRPALSRTVSLERKGVMAARASSTPIRSLLSLPTTRLKKLRFNQCWGSGSACFWASRIRIHQSEVCILPFSHKCVEQTEKIIAK